MRLVTAREMQTIDRRTIDGGFVPSLVLMERAGEAVARHVVHAAHGRPGGVEILCGKGNNGGDGLVVARLIAAQGIAVRVHLTHAPAELSADARANFERLDTSRVAVEVLPATLEDLGPRGDGDPPAGAERCTDAATRRLFETLQQAAVCVDALLGTGVTSALQGRLAALVNLLNHAARTAIAIDVPSGIDGDTGAVYGVAVRATQTVTCGFQKVGLLFHPGRAHAGRVHVADLGFPAAIAAAVAPARFAIDGALVRSWAPRHAPGAHKYQRGVVAIVAGSEAYAGAAVLTALSALRAGAGMVHVFVPEGLRALLQMRVLEAIVHGVQSDDDGGFARDAAAEIQASLPRTHARALVIGPGLGSGEEPRDCARAVLAAWPGPAVVDADALAALPLPAAAARIVTPHDGELARWLGTPVPQSALDRLQFVAGAARTRQVTLLAKGPATIVATPEGELYVNTTGVPALATAGSGDVLAGAIGALLAQGLAPERAAGLGAWMHGMAAQAAAGTHGSGVIARDIAAELGWALQTAAAWDPQ